MRMPWFWRNSPSKLSCKRDLRTIWITWTLSSLPEGLTSSSLRRSVSLSLRRMTSLCPYSLQMSIQLRSGTTSWSDRSIEPTELRQTHCPSSVTLVNLCSIEPMRALTRRLTMTMVSLPWTFLNSRRSRNLIKLSRMANHQEKGLRSSYQTRCKVNLLIPKRSHFCPLDREECTPSKSWNMSKPSRPTWKSRYIPEIQSLM